VYNGQRIGKKKTQVKKKTLNPTFNESFQFDLPPACSTPVPGSSGHTHTSDFSARCTHVPGARSLYPRGVPSSLDPQAVPRSHTHLTLRCLNPYTPAPGSSGRTYLRGIRLQFVVYDWDRLTRNEVIGRLEMGDRANEPDTPAGRQWNEMVNCPRKQVAEWHHLMP